MSHRLLILISYVVAIILIIAGGMIYLCQRSLSLAMFRWVGLSSSSKWLMTLREMTPDQLPEWIKYSLPDGLWSCAYVIFIGAIWKLEYPKCMTVALIMPLIGILSEVLQKIGLISGVYDNIDLIMYIIGGLYGWAFIYLLNYLNKKKQYEKN